MTGFFCVHIPKTAGTSLRRGLEKNENVSIYCDYGMDSSETSKLIKKEVYCKNGDIWEAWNKTSSQNSINILYGHMPCSKYLTLVGVNNIITFLRDPIERLMSEYQHFIRHKGYDKSFEEFYTQPNMINRQTKMLAGAPLEAIGYIGITDDYKSSINLLSNKINENILHLEKNLGVKSVRSLYKVDLKTRRRITALNKYDIAYYRKALSINNQRKEFFDLGKPWCHAQVTTIKSDSISGWAWWDVNSDIPVRIELIVGGTLISEKSASEFCMLSLKFSPPRDGWVGFNFSIPSKIKGKISCRVKSTGQIIFNQ